MDKDYLTLKRASASRLSGEWGENDYHVLSEGVVVGRIVKAAASPADKPWMWTVLFGYHEDRTPTPPKGGLLFLHYLDVLPPDGSGRFTQSERPLGQLQIVCRKRHQMFGHARLGTLLCEPYAPFG
jgi:hypothetical protein